MSAKASDQVDAPAVGISFEELALFVSMTDPTPLVLVADRVGESEARDEALAALVARGILVWSSTGFAPVGGEAGVIAAAMVADDALTFLAGGNEERALTFLAADGRLVCQQTDAAGHRFALVDRPSAVAAAADALGSGTPFAGLESDGDVGGEELIAISAWEAALEAADAEAAVGLLPVPLGLASAVFETERITAVNRTHRAEDGAVEGQQFTCFSADDGGHFWLVRTAPKADQLTAELVTASALLERIEILIP